MFIDLSLQERVVCILLAALIGWLVGWLLGRPRRGRPAESLDAELAGKLRFSDNERTRLHIENADLKARIRALESTAREQQDFPSHLGDTLDLSSAFGALGERSRLREELAEAKQKLEAYELSMRDERSSIKSGTSKARRGHRKTIHRNMQRKI